MLFLRQSKQQTKTDYLSYSSRDHFEEVFQLLSQTTTYKCLSVAAEEIFLAAGRSAENGQDGFAADGHADDLLGPCHSPADRSDFVGCWALESETSSTEDLGYELEGSADLLEGLFQKQRTTCAGGEGAERDL